MSRREEGALSAGSGGSVKSCLAQTLNRRPKHAQVAHRKLFISGLESETSGWTRPKSGALALEFPQAVTQTWYFLGWGGGKEND